MRPFIIEIGFGNWVLDGIEINLAKCNFAKINIANIREPHKAQSIKEHPRALPPNVVSLLLSSPTTPSTPLLSTKIFLTTPQLPLPEPRGGSLGCEIDPNPFPWRTPPFSSWESQGSRSFPQNSSFNIKSSTFVTRWVISDFLLSRCVVTWCTQTMGFIFMLNGSRAMRGRIYQLDCGYGYIKVVSGNDNGYGRLERWEGGENG